mmetsp:Transcript_15774/g.37201  ORF Transcript_15774/g.37201 Transcript_15774/m.37201 type:complete len:167 (-) Transcript_15774:66-566(-)
MTHHPVQLSPAWHFARVPSTKQGMKIGCSSLPAVQFKLLAPQDWDSPCRQAQAADCLQPLPFLEAMPLIGLVDVTSPDKFVNLRETTSWNSLAPFRPRRGPDTSASCSTFPVRGLKMRTHVGIIRPAAKHCVHRTDMGHMAWAQASILLRTSNISASSCTLELGGL